MIRLADLKKGDTIFHCYKDAWSTRLLITEEIHSFYGEPCVCTEYAERFGVHPKGEIETLFLKDEDRLFRDESDMLKYQESWKNDIFDLSHFELTQFLLLKIIDTLSDNDKLLYMRALEQFRED